MIALLHHLCRLLARDDLTVEDVVRAVGSVVRDPGVPMPMILQPSVPGVRAASLGRYPETGLPYLLVLEFERSAQPTVAELAAAFGRYQRTYSDRGMPIPLLFEPVADASAWTVALIADLPSGTGALDAAKAERVALRRDPVTAPSGRSRTDAVRHAS